IVCGPVPSVVVLALVATPLLRGTGTPKFTASTWNCTVPVGVPEPEDWGVTVAVKVTDWPKTEGFDALATAVLVGTAASKTLTLSKANPWVGMTNALELSCWNLIRVSEPRVNPLAAAIVLRLNVLVW